MSALEGYRISFDQKDVHKGWMLYLKLLYCD